MAREPRPWLAAVSLCLGFGCVVGVCISVVAWLMPVDVIQGWAFNQAPPEPFAQFEATGRAEALWWLLRVSAVGGTLLIGYAWYRRINSARFAAGLIDDFLLVVNLRPPTDAPRTIGRYVDSGIRCFGILAMLTLAGVHQVQGIQQRASDWSYYRLNDGGEILPNISDSNRAVIRYLRYATPENSRIFVVSDQKLYFLSYYLLPRRLLHSMHPLAEHLMPRAHQGRQMSAYRLSEIPPALLREQRPDFVLEYFEGPEYVQPERATEDLAWLNFIRSWQRDADYVPPYTVVLRPWTEAAP